MGPSERPLLTMLARNAPLSRSSTLTVAVTPRLRSSLMVWLSSMSPE